MRVRFLQGIASDRWHYEPGEVAELPDEMAKNYLKSGVAVSAEPARCPHCHAVLDEAPPPEREAAVLTTPRRRG